MFMLKTTSKIFKALSDPNRLRILKMLEIRELCVCEMTEVLQLATSTVSKHLSLLRNANLIWDRKDGKWVNYGLNKSFTVPLVNEVLKLIKNTDDVVFDEDSSRIKLINRDIICGIKK